MTGRERGKGWSKVYPWGSNHQVQLILLLLPICGVVVVAEVDDRERKRVWMEQGGVGNHQVQLILRHVNWPRIRGILRKRIAFSAGKKTDP